MNYPERFSSCPSNWDKYQGSCYLMVNTHMSWSSAEAHCAGHQANLVSAHSLWEYNFLKQMARNSLKSSAWMGGFYFQGRWRWEDNTQYDYQNWYSQSSTSSYQCLHLNSFETRGWSNANCNSALPFICVRRSTYC
ncbi:ladderlectin-like [Diretmus argenteus]